VIFYAIKHKLTGRYLPPGLGHGGRGFTHCEPVDGQAYHPRLFHTLGAAKCALAWWLKGATTVSRASYAGFGFDHDDVDESWHTEPVPGRIAEEVEIVKIELKETLL
jgi:hypothetical protein